ncbi:Apoptotic ATPase [Handroanthus impetiginosus]|uniref:Apoptotic ATPase n=1 Tax=Handroanthus impetiginosus TaxID=429701 RepID=A0A2G9HUC7_9LAMI|nr:Apoptotic ATPase [Handroanthus impetiginosus]
MEKPFQPPVVLESKPLETSEEFESRRLIQENIIAALKHKNINTIGICGVRGIGKTRMATRIGEKVKEEKLFNFVLMVRVGASPDLKRIMYEISDYLGVRFEGGNFVAAGNELLSKLNMEERILIILDDVRHILHIVELGILLQKHKGSCKILLTSRSYVVCLAMGAQKIFTVTGFTKEEVGKSIDSSDLYPLASYGAEGCRGLPLAPNKKLNPALSQETVAQSVSFRKSVLSTLEAKAMARVFLKKRERVNAMLLAGKWPGPLSSQYMGTKVEKFLGKGVPKGARLRNDMNPQSVRSTSKKATMTEVVDTDPPERFPLERGEERWDEDVSTHLFSLRTKATEGHKEEISHEAKSIVSMDVVWGTERMTIDVNDCILFCSVFPSDYKFTRDMLVCQWIAQGLIKLEKDEIMEEVYIQCFNTLLNWDYIVPCGYDHYFDLTKYKVGDKMDAFLPKQRLEPKFQKDLDSNEIDVAKIEHLSLAFKEFDHINFGILKQCSGLQTLMIHQCYGCKVKCPPSDLFLNLKDLKILDLSHTDVVVLPSSVVNLKELQCLDISETPLISLPNSIHCLSNLQTLKLDGCSQLIRLPECMSELINLQHLVLDDVQLQSLPKGIGKLSKLRTLGSFYVGDGDGNHIGELKNMNNLKGSFQILNLEYVTTKEAGAEACLCNKQDLRKVNLCWSDLQDEKNPNEEEILQSLQPPFGIQELTVMFYSGEVLPSWMSNSSFSELVSISLYWCRYWSSLPSLGELPALKLLKIVENNELMEINNFFCRQQTDQHHVAFPKLEKLSFVSMYKLEKWTGIENGNFPSLHSLIIEYCPKFVALPFLSRLNSLSHMEIRSCQELSCLPEGGLPATLGCLMITDCPKLKPRCCNEQCEDWSKVANVPDLYIDCQKVSVQL